MSTSTNGLTIDSLIPKEMAVRAENIGVAKANSGPRRLLVLGILAGAFIAFGAIFATTISAGASNTLPYGVTRLLSGLVFSLGLILVVVGGAELFTGNNLIIMAWASKKVTTQNLLRNWMIVYVGNFFGAIIIALLIFFSGQYMNGNGAVGATAVNIALSKVSLTWVQAITLGILCNILVCLAVWLTIGARTTTDKIMAIIFPITGFVAAGFEHCVANMYFVPVGLFIKDFAGPDFWAVTSLSAADFAGITWQAFFLNNLIPVTIGNIIGGTVFVGFVYWSLYLRQPKSKRGRRRSTTSVAAAD